MISVGNKIPVAGKGQPDVSPEEGIDVLFSQPRDQANLSRNLTVAFWLTAFILGALHVWPRRFEMFPDGVPYLDIGDAYFRADWGTAANAYWSPLYSWLLGIAIYLLRPSSYWEYPVVHLINFLIYIGALICFSVFLKELIRVRQNLSGVEQSQSLPEWAWIALGYSLFIWSSLSLISITTATPDMLVAALVYLAAAMLLRIHKGRQRWGTYIVLGVVLGFSYLSKSAMLPMMFVFLGVALLASGSLRKGIPRTLIALACFFLVAGPFIAFLSSAKGYVTLGESGRLNYAWAIHRTTLIHWQGEYGNIDTGRPTNPTRKIYQRPPIYEFGSPIIATYPPWFDPTYWFEGLQPRFDLKGQIKTLVYNLRQYDGLLLTEVQYGIVVGLITLILVSARRRWSWVKEIFSCWKLLVPSVAAFAMYTIVAIRPRYVAPFILFLWLGLFFGVRLPFKKEGARFASSVTLAIVIVISAFILPMTAQDTSALVRDLKNGPDHESHKYWQVADGLSRLGVQPGDQVAVIQSTPDRRHQPALWARLARVRIVAEVTPAAVFLTQNASEFWEENYIAEVIGAFDQTPAKVIVSERAPSGIEMPGWQQIGNTEWFAFRLKS